MGSSRARVRIHIPCIGKWIINYWTTREVPSSFLFHSLASSLGVLTHSVSRSNPSPTPLTPGPSLFLPRSPLVPHQDPHLDKFFTLVHVLEEGAFPFRLKDAVLSEGTVEQELRASLAALRLASPEPLVAFSHHVLDKLVRLVVRPPVIGGQIGELSQTQT